MARPRSLGLGGQCRVAGVEYGAQLRDETLPGSFDLLRSLLVHPLAVVIKITMPPTNSVEVTVTLFSKLLDLFAVVRVEDDRFGILGHRLVTGRFVYGCELASTRAERGAGYHFLPLR